MWVKDSYFFKWHSFLSSAGESVTTLYLNTDLWVLKTAQHIPKGFAELNTETELLQHWIRFTQNQSLAFNNSVAAITTFHTVGAAEQLWVLWESHFPFMILLTQLNYFYIMTDKYDRKISHEIKN